MSGDDFPRIDRKKYEQLPERGPKRKYSSVSVEVYTVREVLREKARYLLVAFIPVYFLVLLGSAFIGKENVALSTLPLLVIVYGYYFGVVDRKEKNGGKVEHEDADEV